MSYYQLTIEEEKLLLTKNRKGDILFELGIMTVVLGVVGFCLYRSQADLMAIILTVFAIMYLIFLSVKIHESLQDQDMVIIRQDAHHFYINDEFTLLNNQTDYLDVYVTHPRRGADVYAVSIVTTTDNIEIMSGLDPGEYERLSVQLSEFLGLPRKIRRPWFKTQLRKLFRISD